MSEGSHKIKTGLKNQESIVIKVFRKLNRNSNETATNLNLTTIENATQDFFQKHIKRYAFVVASSVNDEKQKDDITDRNSLSLM